MLKNPEWGQKSVLAAGPGAMWVIATQMGGGVDARWQVCCPGCGTKVYNMVSHPYLAESPITGQQWMEPGYTFTGDVARPETLSIAEEVEFVPCGCGKWRLTNGWWRAQTSKSVILT